MLALNIGSGQRRFESRLGWNWVNVDCVSREHQVPDIIADARHLPYDDGTVDLCVFHHILEHFGCGEADGIIKECHRVLTERGSLLVFVPDLKQLAGRWLRGEIDDFIFMVNVYGAYQGEEGDRHRWGYTQDNLVTYLKKQADWNWVGPFEYRNIPGANIALDWWIAMAECVK